MQDIHDGNFFALEGQDSSGKATQSALLVNHLTKIGRPVYACSLPNYGHPSAFMVEKYLSGAFGRSTLICPYIASTFYALDRFYTTQTSVRPWLDGSGVVVADRWVLSNKAHQGTKISDAPDGTHFQKFCKWLDEHEHARLQAPRPFYLVLNVSPEISFEKARERAQGKKQDGHEINFEHIARAQEIYVRHTHAHPNSSALIECCDRKGDLLKKEVIHEQIWEVVWPRIIEVSKRLT